MLPIRALKPMSYPQISLLGLRDMVLEMCLYTPLNPCLKPFKAPRYGTGDVPIHCQREVTYTLQIHALNPRILPPKSLGREKIDSRYDSIYTTILPPKSLGREIVYILSKQPYILSKQSYILSLTWYWRCVYGGSWLLSVWRQRYIGALAFLGLSRRTARLFVGLVYKRALFW